MNLEVLGEHDSTYLLVLAGDQVYAMDYHALIEHHVESGADVTVSAVSVPAEDAERLGVIDCDEGGRIRRFVEKPADPRSLAGPDGTVLGSMGIYVFDFGRLRAILGADDENGSSRPDFGRDVIPALIEGGHVACFRFTDPATGQPGYWRDLDTLDAYYRGQMELVEPVPPFNLYDERWPIWSYEAHLPPAKLAPDERGGFGTAERCLLASGSIVTGGEVTESVLSYGTRIDRSEASGCVFLPGARVERGCRLRRIIVDEDVVLPPGTEIGFDPEADRTRFHVTEAGVVLVTREMVAALVDGAAGPRQPAAALTLADGEEV
jgi:glucose-1-phosphate adenylyltransferase